MNDTLWMCDIAANPIPYPRTAAYRRGARWTVTNAGRLAALQAFYDEFALRVKRPPEPLTGRLSVVAELRRRGPRDKADLDNLIKALADAMTKAGIWKDDRQVKHWDVALVEEGMTVEPRIQVTVAQVKDS